MAIRISGLSSGLDTESLVSELVSAYSIKKDNYVKAQTKLGWKQDAWKALNKKVYSLYSNISSMRYSSAYSLKKTSVSDATKASVTASSNAVNGTQRLKITSLAAAGYLTGGQLKKGDAGDTTAVTSSTKLSELKGNGFGLTSGESGTINVNGKEISVSGDDTVNTVVNRLKDAGVNASYDEKNNRIFVSSKNSGTDNEFTLTASNENGAKALQSLGLMTASKSAQAANQALVNKYVTGDEVNLDAIKQDITSKALTASSYGNSDYVKNLKAYGYATSGDRASILADYDTYLAQKTKLDSVDSNFSLTAYKSLKEQSEEDLANHYFDKSTGTSVTKEEYDAYLANDTLTEEDKTAYKEKYTLGTDWLSEQQGYLTSAGYSNAEDYEADLNAKKTYEASHDANDRAALDMVKNSDNADTYLNAAATAYSDKVKEAQAALKGTGLYEASEGATRVDATDATIYLNGAEFTSNSNTFNINGLTINAAATTGTTFENAEEISITTNTDSQAIYDKVKDFLSQYNELVNEMSSLYNAASAKGYEP
ncbi:MAG: flagellar filament capping protein FliD, partial [Lachnospiraceae bacterium]|nr:flagellar filament capping protein FliD [Lachnospiraceae bacterium]